MNTANKWIHRITLATLAFMVCLGAVIVFAELKPFWVDEWFIILSLKTRSVSALFDKLEFMQQFPRVYLALIKVFAAQCNYSYLSLLQTYPAYNMQQHLPVHAIADANNAKAQLQYLGIDSAMVADGVELVVVCTISSIRN